MVYKTRPAKSFGNFRRRGFMQSSISVTWMLLIVNVLLFIVFGFLILRGIVPLDYVAINPSQILQGKTLWTFLTSMFMHGGLFHLFVNMITLLFMGTLAERLLGKKRFLWFYIFSGIFASLFFVAWRFIGSYYGLGLDVPAVGASGALFAIIGFLVIITPNLPVYAMFIPIPIKMKYAAPGILLLLWLISLGANIPIGNEAHLGGLLAGLIYGLYIRNKYKKKSKAISRYFS